MIQDEIQRSAAELNAACDAASRSASQIEEFLAGCGVGIETHYYKPVAGKRVQVGYLKIGRRWRIGIMYEAATEYAAWSECTRDAKLDAAPLLPHLMAKIAESVKTRAARATLAVDTLDSVLATLRSGATA